MLFTLARDIVGGLDCPAFGQEIGCIIPSKVPLGESFNDAIIPGKRYSFRQVLHQQRVLGRKVEALELNLFHYILVGFRSCHVFFRIS